MLFTTLFSSMQPVKLTDFGTKGADLKGIFYLRNVVDADAIVEAIGQAKKKSNKVMPAATVIITRVSAHVSHRAHMREAGRLETLSGAS